MGRDLNPVTAHRRAEKAKTIKKSREQVTERRTERLAGRNPKRIEQAIEDLKSRLQGGRLTAGENERLARLEKELADVERAKRKRPDVKPQAGQRGQDDGWPRGEKRRRSDGEESDGGSTDPEVRRIPMPRDSPPLLPSVVKERMKEERRLEWEEEDQNRKHRGPCELPMKPHSDLQSVVVKNSYSAEPILRNLKEEAIKAFVPNVLRSVRAQLVSVDVQQGDEFLEPEEREATVVAEVESTNPSLSASAVGEGLKDTAGPSFVAHNESTHHELRKESRVEAESVHSEDVGAKSLGSLKFSSVKKSFTENNLAGYIGDDTEDEW